MIGHGKTSGDALGTATLAAALGSAIAFRLYLLFVHDFPVNDGGLFVAFVRAIAETFPALPAEAHYNGLNLPFAYPPLSFWIGALGVRLGFDSVEVVRTLPIAFNILYVLLFTSLLLKQGESKLFAALAVAFMAVTLRSFEWLLMGGGLSRGLGAVFLLLTLHAILIPHGRQRQEIGYFRAAIAGIMVGGAILSHLEWGIIAAAAVVLSRALASGSIKDFVVSSAVAGAAAILLIAPWLIWVHSSHGLEPLLAAGRTGGWGFTKVAVRLLEVGIIPARANPLVIVGALVLLAKRQWFWFGFVLICAGLTPRHAPTPLALPVAVFAAQGVISSYYWAARFVHSRRLLTGASIALVLALLAYGAQRSMIEAERSFKVLPAEMRRGTAWVGAHREGAAVVMIHDRAWDHDHAGEWFPVLARARSITTVQGREWTGQFARWEALSAALRESRTCAELRARMEAFGAFDLVWAEKLGSCFPAPEFQPVFRNSLVTIYQVQQASAQ